MADPGAFLSREVRTAGTRSHQGSLDRGSRRLSVGLLGACFATISWNAVLLHGIQFADWLLLAAAIAIGMDVLASQDVVRLPPAGMWLGAGLIATAGLWSALSPASPNYLAQRYVAPNAYEIYGHGKRAASNLAQLGKFEIALIVLPALVACVRLSHRDVRWLANCSLFAAVVNALVAVSDKFVHTTLSDRLLGFADSSGREAGLTLQPNHLAVAIVFAIPIATTWLASRRSRGVVVLVILFVGLFLTGSRGGLVAGVLALSLSIVSMQRIRRAAFWLGSAALLVFAALANDLSRVAGLTRFRDATAQLSDSSRLHLIGQGFADWFHSPWHGIGFIAATDAHEVHLQLLAAGGVLALAGALAYGAVMLSAARAAAHSDEILGRALLIIVCSWLALMFVENQLTNLYLFAPVALSLALIDAHGSSELRQLQASAPVDNERSKNIRQASAVGAT